MKMVWLLIILSAGSAATLAAGQSQVANNILSTVAKANPHQKDEKNSDYDKRIQVAYETYARKYHQNYGVAF